MNIKPVNIVKQSLFAVMAFASVSMGAVHAFDSDNHGNQNVADWADDSTSIYEYQNQDDWQNAPGDYSQPGVRQQIRNVETPLRWVQNNRGNFRSKGEVVKEVKRRYNAKVLKISLNEQRAVYNVRMLMPSGKVRNIQVSARR